MADVGADMEVDMAADMDLDIVADMEMGKVADMMADKKKHGVGHVGRQRLQHQHGNPIW